ncbi:MAG: Histidinol dehydrogenase [Promethearchaeota archaeon]|nr:MAG: Histidinol dehydrogenase [Candidatus Lokiarchaeota archaeon]
MVRIYSVKEAKETILVRDLFTEFKIPKKIQKKNFEIFGREISPEEAVREIILDVKDRGDVALKEWTRKLDGVLLDDFEVSQKEIEDSVKKISAPLRRSLEIAIKRVLKFHEEQPINKWFMDLKEGELGQIIKPIEKVGIYIPGGTAPLISSVYMSTIPAIVANCKELIITTPPSKDGSISIEIKGVCGLLKRKFGISLRVFKVGGAQAISAMAYGTSQVPKVYKIVGAGNIYVNLAKKFVYGIVGIDGMAGPTEAIIIADKTAKKEFVALDFLAQAEHDYLAIPLIITHSTRFGQEVKKEIEKRLNNTTRKEIIAQSIRNKGGIIITKSLEESITLTNDFAPEHLSLMIKEPQRKIAKIQNAGGIFIGDNSCEVLGDYVAGPSHVMPTNGAAKYRSALSVLDFVKFINIINLERKQAIDLAKSAKIIAKAEKLEAHSRAAKIREEKIQ